VIAPYYAYNNSWHTTPQGKISIPAMTNWVYGGRGQATARVLSAWVKYYQYSGDPAAIASITAVADSLLDTCLTGPTNPWPGFLISVPVAGKPYGQCSENGFIQLDIVGEAGVALLDAYQLTGNVRYFDVVKHWGDEFAEKRNRNPEVAPWGRYANPERVPWANTKDAAVQTGGVVYELSMLDELMRLGYRGTNDGIVKARDAALDYLKNVLLPAWYVNDTWGRNYWDWQDPVQSQTTTDWVAAYIMNHRSLFPNWRSDVRNILTIFLNHTGVSRKSNGMPYSGAWAFPESDGCCLESLAWGPLAFAADFAQYGNETKDPWARELARRMEIITTYDARDNGVAEDKIYGGSIEAADWFVSIGPSALYYVLDAIGWMPDLFAPSRENHIVRSTSVVNHVYYGKGDITYTVFDAPTPTTTVLRLAFRPSQVIADGRSLALHADRERLDSDGYDATRLSNGDYIVTIRQDGAKSVTIRGADPQQIVDDVKVAYSGAWDIRHEPLAYQGTEHVTSVAGSKANFRFTGNQIRMLSAVGPEGGKAAIYLDGALQLVGIDFWNPTRLQKQVVYYRSGLAQGPHTLSIVALSDRNPYSRGNQIDVDAIETSAATGSTGFGSGGGPTATQRMIFGYTSRYDYIDSNGQAWHPGTEFVARTGNLTDSVADTWYTMKQALTVHGTQDPVLYEHGVHAPAFTVYVTVGPGKYYVRLMFSENRIPEHARAMDIYINGQLEFRHFDVLATARKKEEEARGASSATSPQSEISPSAHGVEDPHPGSGIWRAVDLVVNGVKPKDGLIEIRLQGVKLSGVQSEAMLQALEVGPGEHPDGDSAVSAP